MALFGKLTQYAGLASVALLLPLTASANEPAKAAVEASHFNSSGRLVNVVADMTPTDQADARAAIWALTGHATAPDCSKLESCITTFQTGAN